MTTPNEQLFNRDWQRRANQFRQAGIPEDAWKQLYTRDQFNVLQKGGTPMTDADVYAGVNSAVHGPQIKDPTLQHGGHGWWSGITDVIGNVGQDVKGIITGWPAGIAHIAAHLPSELENSGELIAHLANGDNTWLHQKGYLQAGDNLHNSWSDFATILRAMDANGSKQLLPMVPFISDLANMTTGQGRNILMQHPVGTVLDAWPGITGAGKLATAGKDFSMAAVAERAGMPQVAQGFREADQARNLTAARQGARRPPTQPYDRSLLPEPLKAQEPRLWAAGRALQRGNPLTAVFSATGDLIPWTHDDFGNVTTLRQAINTRASASGLSRAVREGVVRPFENMKQEATARIGAFTKHYFGNDLWKNLKADRALYMWKGSHGINPNSTNGRIPFQSIDEYNQWRDTLSPEENAGLTSAREITEYQRKAAIQRGWADEIRMPHGIVTVSTDSKIWKLYQQRKALAEKYNDAYNRGDIANATKHANDLKAVNDKFAQAQLDVIPAEWQQAFAAHIREGARGMAMAQMFSAEGLKNALNVIDSNKSITADFERVLGKDKFVELKADAIRWWWKMSEQGMAPLWMHDFSPKQMEKILSPQRSMIAKEMRPSFLKEPKGSFGDINFGETVMDINAVLNRTEAEMVWSQMNTDFVKGFIAPRAYTNANKRAQFEAAIDEARKHLGPDKAKNLPTVDKVMRDNFEEFDPEKFGLRKVQFRKEQAELVLDKETAEVLKKLVAPPKEILNNAIVRKGTVLYKFAVLTGPRHLAHVGVGGFMMMMGGEPLAPAYFWRALKLMSGRANPEDYGLAGASLAGLKEDYYQLGPRHTYQDYRIAAERAWSHQTGGIITEHYLTQKIHEATQLGKTVAEFVPNELSKLETNIMTMYKVSVYLSRRSRGFEEKAALEAAHKLFVDMNGMSTIERTLMRTIFPFYAFTRHLFRYLGSYPIDYPLRASIITNFAEQEQTDWKNGLPRSYQSLFMLGSTNALGDVRAFDLKNANPFRSFANDFSLAGFTSSLSPFITMPMNIMGVDTLSGTTQLYPGTTFNPYTGTLQATPQPGWEFSVADAFVPQFGLLDHFKKLTEATKFIAATDPAAYRKQLYNMLNMPFMPEVINVPYAKEITEMRRFRQASAMVSTVNKNPSAQNISKLLEFNVVPFDNRLIPSNVIAAYYERVKAAMARAGESQISPAAVIRKPPRVAPSLSKELAPASATGGP